MKVTLEEFAEQVTSRVPVLVRLKDGFEVKPVHPDTGNSFFVEEKHDAIDEHVLGYYTGRERGDICIITNGGVLDYVKGSQIKSITTLEGRKRYEIQPSSGSD